MGATVQNNEYSEVVNTEYSEMVNTIQRGGQDRQGGQQGPPNTARWSTEYSEVNTGTVTDQLQGANGALPPTESIELD